MNDRMIDLKKLKFYIIFLPVLFCWGSAFTQSLAAKVKLDTNAMLIGDQVKLELTLSFPQKTLVKWPLIGDSLMHGIQVINRSKMDTIISSDRKSVTIHQSLILTSFDSGMYMLPELRFYYRQPPDTAIRFIPSEILMLNVNTLAVDTTKAFKPIKGPMKVPMTFRELLPYLIIGILLVLIVAGVVWYFRKRKKSEPFFQLKPKIQLPAHEIALNELGKLKDRKLWQEGKIKAYHSEVTDIIRRYLENRFSVMALEMTTYEILTDIGIKTKIDKEFINKLNYLLTLADLVKFAKMQPLPTENEMSMEHAVSFVRETAYKKDQTATND